MFSAPEAGDSPGFDAGVVDTAKAGATLNGVTATKNGTFFDANGDGVVDGIEFTFSQCAVAAESTIVNGQAELLFVANTEQDGFAIHSDTVDAH